MIDSKSFIGPKITISFGLEDQHRISHKLKINNMLTWLYVLCILCALFPIHNKM